MSETEGALQVWWTPQIPMEPMRIPVSSIEDAAKLLNVLAEYDAFQYLNNVKPDYCNSGGLMVFEDGEWVDWQDPETWEDQPENAYPQPSLGWCAKLNGEPSND